MNPSSPVPEQPTPENTAADAPPAAVDPADRPWFTFPPFPKPPPGVELLSFQDFKPLGIYIPETVEEGAERPVELDGLGIATLTLRVRHDLTTMEKRKRKSARTKIAADGSIVPKRWYEEWAELEHIRSTNGPIDPNLPRAERFYQAAADFKSGRLFSPNYSVNQELTQYWDKFRHFVGLISSLQSAIQRKNAAARAMAEQIAADDGDDDLDEMPNARRPKEASINVANNPESATRQHVTIPRSNRTDEERKHRREYFREVRDTKMDRFLNDPEEVIKIFFSNFASDRGDIHSEKFCGNAPILIGFFLKFLQRNRVFPDIERQLRKAIAVAELAQKELPHAISMNKAIPETFGLGCREIYGAMNGYNIWQDDSNSENSEGDEAEEERATKKQRTDNGNTHADDAQTTAAAAEPSISQTIANDQAMAEDPEAAKKAEEAAALRATLETDGSQPIEVEIVDPEAERASGGVWGDWDDSENVWGEANAADEWGLTPQPNPVHRLLGPTALPLTHTTGIVERSTRRIKSVVLPPTPAAAPAKGTGKEKTKDTGIAPLHDPAAVEQELEARLAKMTLSAWPVYGANANADVQKPRILPDSRGAAVLDDVEGAEVAAGPGTPHNPFKDDIVVYVDPEIADKMWKGMSIEAVFVQLARVDPSVPIEVDPKMFNNPWGYAKKKAEGAPGVPVEWRNIWYMEEVRAVLPSYHTEMMPLPTDKDVFGEPEE